MWPLKKKKNKIQPSQNNVQIQSASDSLFMANLLWFSNNDEKSPPKEDYSLDSSSSISYDHTPSYDGGSSSSYDSGGSSCGGGFD